MPGRERGTVVSEAVELMLKNYPGSNMAEFHARYEGAQAQRLDGEVRALLAEAMGTAVDWAGTSLSEGGDAVEAAMRRKHPELSAGALRAIRYYDTFHMRRRRRGGVSRGRRRRRCRGASIGGRRRRWRS